ncbi:phosphatidate cytidylyltransferase [Treponema parvum]|uniref:phosphatidate cytidylyltransferase n=1 Tax=Treponema parvum TaxID=138851 RepID=UPI001AEC3B48|nr:phosphatidate cytidylyltransferase [Treponema parvum]QTQ16168.1 phosphatidate cytidylyltransferase [Treponema parvum]
MNKLVQRLLVFFIGIPLVIGVVALSSYNHLVLHFVIMACAFLSAKEMYALLGKKQKQFPLPFIIFLSLIPSAAGLICTRTELPLYYIDLSLLLCFLLILSYEVFTASDFDHSVEHMTTAVFNVFYSGYLLTFVSRLTVLKHSTKLIISFLFMIFMCDSFAWLFGMTLGKNNRGVIKASSNKSVAGFIGGYIGAVLAAVLAQILWPDVFFGSIMKAVSAGIVIASAGIIGDLAESVIKRDAGFKDSGNIMPGRGGLLDSIDSILFACPIFYLIVNFMFGGPKPSF